MPAPRTTPVARSNSGTIWLAVSAQIMARAWASESPAGLRSASSR